MIYSVPPPNILLWNRRVEGTLQGTHIYPMPVSYHYIILYLLSHFLMCLSHLASLLFIYQSIFFLIAFLKYLLFKAICRTLSLSKLFWERSIYETNKNEATLIEVGSGPWSPNNVCPPPPATGAPERTGWDHRQCLTWQMPHLRRRKGVTPSDHILTVHPWES